MNQILSVESPRKNKGGNRAPIQIEKILKFFAIIMLIFGIFMAGTGSYAIYQNSKESTSSTNPTIYIEETSATEITLKVTHKTELSKVTYNWNNEDPTEINCSGKKNVEQKIQIPTGKNTLYIHAVDINGLEGTSQKQYTLQGDIDITFEVEGNNIKVKAEGKEQLSYMTYRWDDEEETTIDIEDMQVEEIVNVPSGLHTLTVSVVDINNNTETKEQEIKGVSKPNVEITTDGDGNFVIKASDEEGIKKIEFIINQTDRKRLNVDQLLPLEERKEYEYSYPLYDGDNELEVRVYNENDVREVVKQTVRK